MIEFRIATYQDALFLDVDAREEEVDEVRASHDLTIYEAAKQSISDSDEAFAVYKDGKLLCITGVASYNETVACPWLLTTNELKQYPKILLKWTKHFVNKWSEQYPVLRNFIDDRYEQSLRWAEWAGFTIYPLGNGFSLIEKVNEEWEQQSYQQQ